MTNNKALFLKWVKNLYYVQFALLIGGVLAAIPLIGGVFKWVNAILTVGVVYILYKMAPTKDRYRKAAIFMGISVGVSLLSGFINVGIFSIAISICSLVGLYQEYCGHSEMLNGIDNALAKKWHSLFNWQIFGGVVLGILGAPIVVLLGVVLLLDTNILTVVILILVTCFDAIIQIVYLSYLKRTREMYEAFPTNMEEGQTGDYI